jgi:hypothetical protein
MNEMESKREQLARSNVEITAERNDAIQVWTGFILCEESTWSNFIYTVGESQTYVS